MDMRKERKKKWRRGGIVGTRVENIDKFVYFGGENE